MNNEPNWQLIMLELRKHFKSSAAIARLIGLSVDRAQDIAAYGTKTMLWTNGNKLIELHNKHCRKIN